MPIGLFVSPDGQWIGFADGRGVLKKVAVTGGPAVTLATLDTAGPGGATWGPDDTIIVATDSVDDRPAAGLRGRRAADGAHAARPRAGRSRSLLARDAARRPRRAVHDHGADGRPRCRTSGRPGSPDRDAPRCSCAAAVTPITYERARGGHLVYAAAGTLRAVPFDLARLETRGTPVTVVPDVVTTIKAA